MLLLCMFLQTTSTEQKLGDITSAVVKELTASCAECGISSDIIDRQSFACFPESHTCDIPCQTGRQL